MYFSHGLKPNLNQIKKKKKLSDFRFKLKLKLINTFNVSYYKISF